MKYGVLVEDESKDPWIIAEAEQLEEILVLFKEITDLIHKHKSGQNEEEIEKHFVDQLGFMPTWALITERKIYKPA